MFLALLAARLLTNLDFTFLKNAKYFGPSNLIGRTPESNFAIID